MAVNHFIYSPETAFGTWVTPAKWVPVNSANINHKRAIRVARQTGTGRAPNREILGFKPVTGALDLFWEVVGIGSMLKTCMQDVNTALVEAGVSSHGLLYDDTLGILGISAQVQLTDAVGFNYLSAILNTLTISAKAEEEVKLAPGLIAKDEAPCGGVWDWSGGASPALISPTAYPSPLLRPFMFHDGALIIDGTPSEAANKITIAGGTDLLYVDNFSCAINHNTKARPSIARDMTVTRAVPQKRDITLEFEIPWEVYTTQFYTAAKAGTAMAFSAEFIGPEIGATGEYHQAYVCIPSLFFDPHDLPPADGSADDKAIKVKGTAQQDSATGYDFNIWLQSSEAAI